MMDYSALLIGIIVAGGGVIAGHRGRYASHQLTVRRDLRFLALLPVELIVILFSAALLEEDAANMILASVLIFDIFYVAGYRMADPKDTLGIETYYEDLRRSFARPIAYYYVDGVQYCMDQNRKAAIRAMLGVRDPLEMDISKIVRTRAVEFTTGRKKKRELYVAAVAIYDRIETPVGCVRRGTTKVIDPTGQEIREPRYMFNFTATTHRIVFADSVMTDPATYDTSVEVREEVVRELMAEKEKNKRLEVQLMSAQYKAGAEMIQGIFDLNVDSFFDELMEIKDQFIEKQEGV